MLFNGLLSHHISSSGLYMGFVHGLFIRCWAGFGCREEQRTGCWAVAGTLALVGAGEPGSG